MKTYRRVRDFVFFLFLVYTIGMFLGIIFILLRAAGRVVVVNSDALRKIQKSGCIITANHPSYLEPFLIPLLFFPRFLLNPFRYFPWDTPDKKNFEQAWYFAWTQYMRGISIERSGNARNGNIGAFRKMVNALQRGQNIIIFPEGGRTFKQEKHVFSNNGKALGKFKEGVAGIQKITQCPIIPVWVENTDLVLPPKKWIPRVWRAKIYIYIGIPIEKQITTEELEGVITKLALRN